MGTPDPENPFPGMPWGKHLVEPRDQPPQSSAGRCAEPPALCQKQPHSQGAREAPHRAALTQRCPGAFAFGQVSAQPAHQSIPARAAGPCYRGQPRVGQEPGPGRPLAYRGQHGRGAAPVGPRLGRCLAGRGSRAARPCRAAQLPERPRGRSFGPGQGSAAWPRSTWGLAGPKTPPAGPANASPDGGRSGTQGPG